MREDQSLWRPSCPVEWLVLSSHSRGPEWDLEHRFECFPARLKEKEEQSSISLSGINQLDGWRELDDDVHIRRSRWRNVKEMNSHEDPVGKIWIELSLSSSKELCWWKLDLNYYKWSSVEEEKSNFVCMKGTVADDFQDRSICWEFGCTFVRTHQHLEKRSLAVNWSSSAISEYYRWHTRLSFQNISFFNSVIWHDLDGGGDACYSSLCAKQNLNCIPHFISETISSLTTCSVKWNRFQSSE